MTISINIRRSSQGPSRPADGLLGAFGGTKAGDVTTEEVEVFASNKVGAQAASKAAIDSFSATHGLTLGKGDILETTLDEDEIFTEGNLSKVREAFMENGVPSGLASEVITTMQGKGILFRERPSHGETAD